MENVVNLLNEKDLLDRVIPIKQLNENCFKYLEQTSKDLLTHKIIFAIAKITREKFGPVKLSEIDKEIFANNDKSKQDLIRLTIEKSLLKCSIVEKLRYSVKDVRYILTGYRFQKIRSLDSFRGDRKETLSDVFEIPKSFWPIPDDYFILKAKRFGLDETRKKINFDYDKNFIPRGKYENLIKFYEDKINDIQKKIETRFKEIDIIIGEVA